MESMALNSTQLCIAAIAAYTQPTRSSGSSNTAGADACELRRNTACLLASLPPPHRMEMEVLGQRLSAACPLAWQAVQATAPSWHLMLLDDPVLRLQRVEEVVYSVLDPTALQDRALKQLVSW